MKNSSKSRPLRNPSASEIPALIAELSASGMGVAAFARSRGLKPQNLYLAQRRARNAPAVAFDPVRIVEIDKQLAPFKLELATGHKLWVPADFECSAVRRLIELLSAC